MSTLTAMWRDGCKEMPDCHSQSLHKVLSHVRVACGAMPATGDLYEEKTSLWSSREALYSQWLSGCWHSPWTHEENELKIFFSTCHPYAHRSKQAVEEVGSCYNDSADHRAVDIKAVAKLPLGASRWQVIRKKGKTHLWGADSGVKRKPLSVLHSISLLDCCGL